MVWTTSRVSFYIFTIHLCNITALVQNWKSVIYRVYLLVILHTWQKSAFHPPCVHLCVCECVCQLPLIKHSESGWAEHNCFSQHSDISSHFLKQLHNHVRGTDYNACFCQEWTDEYKVKHSLSSHKNNLHWLFNKVRNNILIYIILHWEVNESMRLNVLKLIFSVRKAKVTADGNEGLSFKRMCNLFPYKRRVLYKSVWWFYNYKMRH